MFVSIAADVLEPLQLAFKLAQILCVPPVAREITGMVSLAPQIHRGDIGEICRSVLRIKYRSPDGETWSGRGHTPLWLRQLELQGHNRAEYKVTES